MPTPVYSVRFLLGAAVGSSGVSYLVPSSRIAILRDVDAFETTGTAGSVAVVRNAAGGTMIFADTTATDRTMTWRGRQIYEPGEQITFVVFSGTWSVAASGYLLIAP